MRRPVLTKIKNPVQRAIVSQGIAKWRSGPNPENLSVQNQNGNNSDPRVLQMGHNTRYNERVSKATHNDDNNVNTNIL